MRLELGTMLCCFERKNSRKDWRIWAEVIGKERGARSEGEGAGEKRRTKGGGKEMGLGAGEADRAVGEE
jgi:hypothetical protein